jgi:hypothetical protein
MRSSAGTVFKALATALVLFGLSACQADAPPPAAETPTAEEAAPPPPPPPPSPSQETTPLEAPAPESGDLRGTTDAAAGESPRLTESMPSIRSAPPMPGDGPSGVDPNRVLTPVLVELLPTEARQPRQGGSAVVILAPRSDRSIDERRNMALCRELFISFDRATTDEVGVGVRRNAEGETELLRPLYWPTREVTGPTTGADRCAQRLATYDHSRGESIRRKLALSGAGPFLVVERQDMNASERVAAVIDLSRAQPSSIGGVVRYFRDGFMQSGDVWDRNRFQVSRAREEMSGAIGLEVAASVLPRLVRTTRQVGCAFTNLLDACESASP